MAVLPFDEEKSPSPVIGNRLNMTSCLPPSVRFAGDVQTEKNILNTEGADERMIKADKKEKPGRTQRVIYNRKKKADFTKSLSDLIHVKCFFRFRPFPELPGNA
jgi:hypothetical protein